MKQPMVIVASLMRFDGTTGVQSHMGEFVNFMKMRLLPHDVATPFHWSSLPLLAVFIALRKFCERFFKLGAVMVYREGHALLLWCRLTFLMCRHAECVVYAQCPVSARVALSCRRRATQKVALVVHFNVSQAEEWVGKGMIARGGWLDRQIRTMEANVVSRVDGIIFVSRFMQGELAKVWPGLASANVQIIPNFVRSLSGAAPMSAVVGRDLICIGTLEPRKNQGFLIRVLSEALKRGRKVTLTLVGDGPDRTLLQRQVMEAGLTDQVFFEGFSPQGRKFIPGHRLYVHAAQMENLPVVLLEALSAGVPVVAGRVGGIPEVFDEGVEGNFWPLDDVRLACDVLLGMLDDEHQRSVMAEAAMRRFERCFDAEVVAKRLYEGLLSLRAP